MQAPWVTLPTMLTLALLSSCATARLVTGNYFGLVSEAVPKEVRGRGLSDLLQEHHTTDLIKDALRHLDPALEKNIRVHLYGNTALLIGYVGTAQLREQTTKVVANVRGVHLVLNELQTTAPSTANRLQDNLLVGQVKTKLATRADIDVDRVKVVGLDRTIYLLGNLPTAVRDDIGQLAQQVSGVRTIVNRISSD